MMDAVATNLQREPRLGIDIGRVIIAGAQPGGGDTAFFTGDEAAMLATPEVTGALAAIARLTKAFGGKAWLVSKCGPAVEAKTLRWLRAHRFEELTGIPESHIRFCRQRREKRLHCEELQLTHFVDDRPDVHQAIRGAVEHQFLFGAQQQAPPSFTVNVLTWAQAEPAILATR